MKAALILLALLARMAAEAATVLVPCSADTTLQEVLPDSNMGGTSFVAAGAIAQVPEGFLTNPVARGLYRFDLDGKIPPGAKVTAVRLHISLVFHPPGPGSTYQLHRLRKDWGEGNKTLFGRLAEPATAGEATWNAPKHGGPGWALPGASSAEDAVLEPSSSVAMGGFGQYIFPSTSALIADVENWLVNPGSNFGWLMRSDAESTPQTARRFGSRLSGLFAPSLEITYEPNGLRIVEVRAEGAEIFIRWSGGTGPYRVQRADSVEGTFEFAMEPTVEFSVRLPKQGAAGFYRVVGQ